MKGVLALNNVKLPGFVKLKIDSNDVQTMERGEVARPSMVLMDNEVYPRRW